MRTLTVVLLAYAGSIGHTWAQGQDGTPGERNLQIMAELLPGLYDNANQSYFDQRLKYPEDERRARLQVSIEAVEEPGIGDVVFSYQAYPAGGALASARQLWALETADDPQLVRMRIYDMEGPTYLEGCDVLWRRDVGQFTGASVGADCPMSMQLDPSAIWVATGDARPDQLKRARKFSCYADIPGVAGGRDEPFDRYQIDDMHDQGGLQWFTTKDRQRELGVTLRNVEWQMNNEIGAFTRNSLVIYVLERTADGVKTHTYGWTEPRAERIGLNLQWLLVNCFMVSNRDVQPFFD